MKLITYCDTGNSVNLNDGCVEWTGMVVGKIKSHCHETGKVEIEITDSVCIDYINSAKINKVSRGFDLDKTEDKLFIVPPIRKIKCDIHFNLGDE